MKIKGAKIREIREERGMSLSDLSAKTNLSVSFLSEIENGRKKPSLKSLDKIAEVLNINKTLLLDMDTENGIEMGEKIRLLRNKNKWTLAQLAEKTGYSTSYISDIERGKVIPSVDAIKKLSDIFDVPANTILEQSPSFAQKLKRVREEQGLTQSNLASLANVSTGLIGQLETGKVQPSLSTIEKLAGALSISPCYFILNNAGPEEMLNQMSPDLIELLQKKEVQSVLSLICHCNKKELEFILNFIKLYKQSGTNCLGEE